MRFVFAFLLVLQSGGLTYSQYISVAYDEGRIVGGRKTSIEEHPYQVSVRSSDRHVCGGAIISEDWIITAAHCVRGSFARFISIKAGTSDLDAGGTVMRAKRVITHEDYSRRSSDYDIAVIQLERPLAYDHQIKPILLASMGDHYDTNSAAVVTGWGAVRSNGRSTNRLRKVEVPLVSDAECSDLYKKRHAITPRMLCAGYINVGGKDACQGDSGGPLIQDDRLIGIVSWGYGCADPSYPGVYTRIAAVRDWIQEQSGV